MSLTPLQLDTSQGAFTPREIKTPVKDLPGISKLVFTHCSTVHNLITDWVRLQDKGTNICKTISALKIHEFKEDVFPKSLKPLTESLLQALDGMKHILEGIEIINNQLKAVSQLQQQTEPVFNTWSSAKIHQQVAEIYQSLLKEYQLKQCITENIAHCRDENLIEVYVSSWEFDVYFNVDKTAFLFADIGLPIIK